MRDLTQCLKLVEEDKALTSPGAKIPYYPLAIKRGRGAMIEDLDGNRYIDMLSSAGAVNTGHCHPRVVEAVKKQAEELLLYTHVYMYHEPIVKLTKELISIAPGDYRKRVFYGLCGSDANDGAIKMARVATGRPKVVSFIRSYHGSTYGAISLSAVSLPMTRKIGPLLPEIFHVPFPDPYRPPLPGMTPGQTADYCIEQIQTAFDNYMPAEEVAAFIIEPIQGDAGLVVPPVKFMKNLRALCDRHGILLISEEVQQGFGRTGKWFGIENFGVVPDAIVMGKAIASGLPLSGVVARAELMEVLEAPVHGFTIAGNPVCCAASLATIEVIREENLLSHAAELGEHTHERFRAMQKKFDFIGDVRGIGLSVGVDLVVDRETRERHRAAAAKICYRAWEKGLLLSFFSGSVLRIQPPLVITKEEMDKALDIIEESMEEFSKDQIPDSVLDTVKGW
ncbi:MAG: aspartate aminotransferase family protein [Synergistaceae bacterium]|jgi:4-aminobutyrate aminotransferase|nr:aspartate aminotransferase family protein [Synergistaceae bacterium]